MRRKIALMLSAAVFASAGAVYAANPPPATRPALSDSDVQRLVSLLSADDFAVRQQALKSLQAGVADNMRRMVLVQDVMIRVQENMANQLKVMTMAHDLEAVARTAALMEFNDALSRWAMAAMQLPDEQRAEILKWGLSDDGIQIIARAYSPRSDTRPEGIAAMGKVPGLPVSILLSQMLDDPDRAASIAAMDALWDRDPTPQALASLWDKAITATMAAYGVQRGEVRNKMVNFHGRPINLVANNGYNNFNYEDAAMATDVLVHWQAPDTASRLKAFLIDFASQPLDQNNNSYRYQMFLPNYGGPGQDIQRMIDTFRPKEILIVYMRYITAQNINDGNNGESDMNGKKYRYGPRVDMIGRICKYTDQDSESYGIKHIPQFGDRFVIEGSQKEEDAAITKLKTWWEAHKTEYGQKPSTTQPGTTQPAMILEPANPVGGHPLGNVLILPATR